MKGRENRGKNGKTNEDFFFFGLISNMDNVACPLKVSGVLTMW